MSGNHFSPSRSLRTPMTNASYLSSYGKLGRSHSLLATEKFLISRTLSPKAAAEIQQRDHIRQRSYTMATNSAAWLSAVKARPFEVKPAPLWTPGENEILIRNRAVAINPIDGILQTFAIFPLNYPTIIGADVAGEVVAVGPNVNFKPGSRVLGYAVGLSTQRNQENAFQAYTILQTNMTAEIPDSISFEAAAVVPLGCSTAAAGLFQDDFLNLQLPTEPAASSTGQTVLIWGGASSVGSNAIQLAVAAGYSVITTASFKNFEYVKKLGASEVFDYRSPTVIEDLVAAFKSKKTAGAMECIGAGGWAGCISVVTQSSGSKFVATTKQGFPDPPEGVTMKLVIATTIKDNRVGQAVYRDFLPQALKAGTFVPSPKPIVVGKGLESVQSAIDFYQKGGVSANKVVVSL